MRLNTLHNDAPGKQKKGDFVSVSTKDMFPWEHYIIIIIMWYVSYNKTVSVHMQHNVTVKHVHWTPEHM